VCVCFVVAPSCEPTIDSQLRMCVCVLCVCVFVEGAQLHVDNRLGTRGGVCVCVCVSSFPSCMKPIDSQLGVMCLWRTPSCKPPIDSQLRMCVCVCLCVRVCGGGCLVACRQLAATRGVCVCVLLSRVPSCMSTTKSQLGCVCLLRTPSCKLTIDSQLRCVCVCVCVLPWPPFASRPSTRI